MPIGFDPNDTFSVRLDCLDQERSESDRASFTVKALTSGQVKSIERLRLEAMKAVSEAECDAKLNEAILLGIVGWENLKDAEGKLVPFGAAALDEFTQRLKFRIAAEYPTRVFFAEADKKK